MVIAFVGSGGKTTLLHEMAAFHRSQGRKVFVTTTTHMAIEPDTLLSDDADSIIAVLEETGYVMAGTADGPKLKSLSYETYMKVCEHADVVLVEADGSKRLPFKYPNAAEPVIYENMDTIIIVCGLHAIGKPASEVTHRWELAKEVLQIADDTPIEASHICTLLLEGYVKPLQRQFPSVHLQVYPAHKPSPEMDTLAEWIQSECLK